MVSQDSIYLIYYDLLVQDLNIYNIYYICCTWQIILLVMNFNHIEEKHTFYFSEFYFLK